MGKDKEPWLGLEKSLIVELKKKKKNLYTNNIMTFVKKSFPPSLLQERNQSLQKWIFNIKN